MITAHHDLSMQYDRASHTIALLSADAKQAEVDAINKEFHLPDRLTVSVLPCGQPNAFYDPAYREIVMCTEFADYLVTIMP